MIKRKHFPLAAVAAAGLLTATFSLGHLSVSHAQDNPPAADHGRPLPPPPRDGGPGPRGERPPHPPRPDADQPPVPPVDPQTAPAAVKTASDALAGLSAGQVWARTAPRGEQQVQATLMFQGKEVARLEFDPANGSLLARGQHLPPPPDGPRGSAAGPREQRGPSARPHPPEPPTDAPVAPDAAADANKPVDAPIRPAPDAPVPDADIPAPVPAVPVNLGPVKAKLAEIVKGLSVGQGAEVLPREGFWKVPIIYQSRVVGELHLSGDGTKVMQDFGASRDAAIFAR